MITGPASEISGAEPQVGKEDPDTVGCGLGSHQGNQVDLESGMDKPGIELSEACPARASATNQGCETGVKSPNMKFFKVFSDSRPPSSSCTRFGTNKRG